ncbi:MAG: MBL fold metallo-hydrolase [Clostridia bacterium]|nr:MBL fold metallo-hydrolase [Clostridia bacterium]
MGLKICSIASGSSGNCIYLASDTTTVVIDAGVSCKRIKQSLLAIGASCNEVNLLVTHSHSDHVCGLKMMCKSLSPTVYAHYLTSPRISLLLDGYNNLREFSGDFYIGDMTISPFKVSHDVPCVGYSVYQGGRKISVVTDVGALTADNMRAIQGSNVVLIESNHDEKMLMANTRYPMELKRRILSDRGHLSNAACAQAVVKCVKSGAKQIILGHLSMENNTPELACAASYSALKSEGLSANICVALQDKMSELIEVN